MRRIATKHLIEWKNSKARKPLILKGARQTGKTWILKEFGKKHFTNYHYFDFERNISRFIPVFESDLNPHNIIKNLTTLTNKKINIEDDLLIFDEIQNIPRALTALKYFHEEIPEFAVCAAGSLLGIILTDESFPVGKVQFLGLKPLNFEEFLINYNNDLLYEAYLEAWKNKKITQAIHLKLNDLLLQYLITGGMPEIVNTYLRDKDFDTDVFNMVRKRQNDLVNSFQNDFSKHSGKNNAMHISTTYQNIPLQLARNIDGSVKRFRFKDVIKRKKGYAQLQGPIEWLVNAELIIKTHICNRAQIPLKAFCKENIFKLYINDIGLLGTLLDLPPSAVLFDHYGFNKGFFMENFVAQELKSVAQTQLYGWAHRNSEIEFLTIKGNHIIPVEVKSGLRTKAKSLQQYIIKYNPLQALVLSKKNFSNKNRKKINIPLYFAGKICI
jgi:uncharacterized protein